MQQHDDLGRPLPMLHTDHVHVYSSNLQLSLGPTDLEQTAKSFGEGGSGLLDPPLSPGPPLRGYAAAPLAPAERKEDRRVVDARERDAQYQQMMQSILERTRQQNQAQEQDEDRRVERLLKHISTEQEFVEQVRGLPAADREHMISLAWPSVLTSAYAMRSQLDRKLDLRDKAKYRRQTELYKEWKEKVYETIQAQINQQLASLRTEDISARRRQLMEDYIRVSNQKRYGLYRDIIIESEYDPLIAHKTLLKYTMSDKSDPLKRELNNTTDKPKHELGKSSSLPSRPILAPTPRPLHPSPPSSLGSRSRRACHSELHDVGPAALDAVWSFRPDLGAPGRAEPVCVARQL